MVRIQLPKSIEGFTAFKDLVTLWAEICPADGVPDRQDFTLARLRAQASNIILYDYLGAEEVIYRLVGSNISDKHDEEFGGINIFRQIPKEQVQDTVTFWQSMKDQPCGGHVRVYYTHEPSGITSQTNLLFLPIFDSSRNVRQFIGLVDFSDRAPKYDATGCVEKDYIESQHQRTFIDVGHGIPE